MIKKEIWFVSTENRNDVFVDAYENKELAEKAARKLTRDYETTGEIGHVRTLETYSVVCYASENGDEQDALEEGLYASIGWDTADTPELKNDWYVKVEDENRKESFDVYSYADNSTTYIDNGVIQPDCGVLSKKWKEISWYIDADIDEIVKNFLEMKKEECTSSEIAEKLEKMTEVMKDLQGRLYNIEEENDR